MIGKTISHFKILEKLGEGGMGVVYRAQDIELDRPVAIKVLRPDFMEDAGRRERFLHEARTAARINHANIGTIHEVGEESGIVFLAMEFVDGETLRQRVGAGPLPLSDVLRIALQVSGGLASAHAAQIIHRDLKPENVVVDREGVAKILDFGLAKLFEDQESHLGRPGDDTVTSGITREGRILGTAAYMSPEQARGQDLDPRSDIFSFGIVLYELVTGKAPFTGETITDTLAKILREDPAPVTTINPDLPAELALIIRKCLEKDVEDRYQSARELVVDLRRLLRDSSSDDYLLSSSLSATYMRPRPRRRLALLIGAASLIALVSAIMWPRFNHSDTPRPPPIENSVAIMTFENLKDPDDPDRWGQILQELIITDLSSFGDLRVLSSQRLHDVKKQVGGTDKPLFDKDIASRVAVSIGARTMLGGTISQLGSTWIVTAQLIDVGAGTVIQSERVDGEDLYRMVDELTEMLRGDLYANVVQASETVPDTAPLREMTTSSLEAYRRYLAGRDKLDRKEFHAAVTEFEAAIAKDPKFGRAYYDLAMAKWWPGQDVEGPKRVLRDYLDRRLYSSVQERQVAEAALGLISREYNGSVPLYEQLTLDYPDDKNVWYGLGEALFHSDPPQREKALAAFEHVLALDPSFALSYEHIMDVYWGQGRFDESIDRVKLWIQTEPENPLAHRYLVGATTRLGDAEAIAEAMTAAELLHQTPVDRRVLLMEAAEGYRTRGDKVNAARLYKLAWKTDPDADDRALFEGLLASLSSPEEIGEIASTLESMADDAPELNRQLDRTKFKLNIELEKYDEAIAQARELIGEHPEAMVALGVALTRAGRIDEAEQLRQEVIASDQQEEYKIAFCRQVAWEMVESGHHETSRAWLESAVEMHDRAVTGDLRERLAWLKVIDGDLDDAGADFKTMFDAGESPVNCSAGLMVVALQQGDYEDAERIGEKLLESGPRTALVYKTLSYALMEQGRFADAIDPARAGLEMDESHTSHVALAWALIQSGQDVEEGVRLAQLARESIPMGRDEKPWITPQTPSAEHALGVAYLKQDRVSEAIAMLEEASRLRPDRPQIREDLALARNAP